MNARRRLGLVRRKQTGRTPIYEKLDPAVASERRRMLKLKQVAPNSYVGRIDGRVVRIFLRSGSWYYTVRDSR